ncbi:anaerobic ribonucleoside-triphosphate reductase [Natrinema salinisoli]|uniref:anaerobic ribonucleoside-triphosphate reductase n=1 Tax=Natrinema salinisoli TaxID=2878535 RepID=UPI001CF02F60|nr:anaerobic ribonucleoside-triphosphate reductase [Natrinema salinisoli]
MVKTGETPAKEGDDEAVEEVEKLNFGQSVYDEDGNELGRVRGFEKSGFFVTTRDGAEGISVEHARSGHEFGEAELMWRCMECGEMGEIDEGLPDQCPNCNTERENLMYWTED